MTQNPDAIEAMSNEVFNSLKNGPLSLYQIIAETYIPSSQIFAVRDHLLAEGSIEERINEGPVLEDEPLTKVYGLPTLHLSDIRGYLRKLVRR